MQWWMMKRRVHVSWQLALLCLGIAIGVFMAPVFGTYFTAVIWVFVALMIIALCLWKNMLYVLPLIFFAGVLLGLWRGSIVQSTLTPYKKLIGHMVTVEGRLAEDPEQNERHGMILKIETKEIDDHSLPGALWVTTSRSGDIRRGDIVTVKGKLAEGFGSFSSSMYRAEVANISRSHDAALDMRDWFSERVQSVISEPAAALGLGFLTGQKQGLSPELEEAMKTAGLTHIVVASGYNLTILVRLSRRLFSKISKYLAALSGALLIGGFIAVTGMSASMSRAGLVAGLCLAAWYYGRKFHPLVLLPFVAAITLFVNPAYAWGDLGWQLSFAAFAGVMVLAPLSQVYFFGSKKPGIIRQVVGETIAAQLVTLPILIAAFGQFSNVALFANVLIVPLVPLAMLLVFMAGIAAAIIPPLAYVIAAAATLILGYMITVTNFFASQSWALTEVSLSWAGIVLCYAMLAGVCVYFWRATRYDLRAANIVE